MNMVKKTYLSVPCRLVCTIDVLDLKSHCVQIN